MSAQTEAKRELERALALLENDRTGSVTIAALRERGVTAPAQAVYDLQLAGYAIDRITSTGPGGCTTYGYRLRNPVHGELDKNADCRELVSDDEGRQPDTQPLDDLTPTNINPKEAFNASTLTRWDPFGELTELRSGFDRAFEDLTDGRERAWTVTIDVERDNRTLVIHAELPGIKPEEVKIEVRDDILTVSGKHKQDTKQKHKHYVRRERRCGPFSRSIALPAGVDANQIDAKTRDGVVGGDDPTPQASKQGADHNHADRRLTVR